MGWLRSNKLYCAYLALAAIGLQIVLSFGHVHPGVANASIASTLVGAATPVPKAPLGQPGHHGKDFCATCVAINLVAHSFVPSVPQLAEPAPGDELSIAIVPDASSSCNGRHHFNRALRRSPDQICCWSFAVASRGAGSVLKPGA